MIKFFTKQLKNKKGFTLVELIVVIAILGILAAIAVPKVGEFRTQAAQSAHDANIRTLKGAANMYLAEEVLDATVTWHEKGKEPAPAAPADANKMWGKYIEEWPIVPKGAMDDGGTAVGETYKVEIVNGTVTVTTADEPTATP